MLIKVMKHELKATYRMMLFISIALVAFSTLLAFYEKVLNNTATAPVWMQTFDVLITIVFVLTAMAVVMVGIFYPALRFQKNMFGDEGYLTNTLPVSSSTLITGKSLIHALWMVVSIVVLFFGAAIVTGFSLSKASFIYDLIQVVKELIGYPAHVTLLIILNVVAVVFASIAMMYLSLAIGNFFSSHKMLASVIVFFVLGNVVQIFSATWLFSFAISTSRDIYVEETGEYVYSVTDVVSGMTPVLLKTLLVELIFAAIFYILTNQIVKKKLNLS